MIRPYRVQQPTQVIAGIGLLPKLDDELSRTGAGRWVLVTDEGVQASGVARQVTDALGSLVVGSYAGCVPNAEEATVVALVKLVAAFGADGLVALGGGSVMDTAKAANLLLTFGGESVQPYLSTRISAPLKLKLACIPTTAGTGSEVSVGALIKDSARGVKMTISSPYLMPDLAVLIPELTVTLPAPLTAATGFDALTHAVEAYSSTRHNPFADGLALEAIRLIVRWLPRVMEEPTDLEGRLYMLTAATMAAQAFNSALLGASHAIAHALGGLHGVQHGVANAVALPVVMAFNRSTLADRLPALAEALGGGDPVAAVVALRRRIGLPERLGQVGVEPSPHLVELALADSLIRVNPRPVSEEEVTQLLEQMR